MGGQHPADRHDGLGLRLIRIVEATAGGVIVHVHVVARSGRTGIAGRHGDALKVRVGAPAVDGRATEAARIVVAQALGVAPALVTVISGEHSRLKRLRVEGLDAASAQRRLEPFLGHSPG